MNLERNSRSSSQLSCRLGISGLGKYSSTRKKQERCTNRMNIHRATLTELFGSGKYFRFHFDWRTHLISRDQTSMCTHGCDRSIGNVMRHTHRYLDNCATPRVMYLALFRIVVVGSPMLRCLCHRRSLVGNPVVSIRECRIRSTSEDGDLRRHCDTIPMRSPVTVGSLFPACCVGSLGVVGSDSRLIQWVITTMA